MPASEGLSCVTGPGGTILSLDFDGDALELFEPVDPSVGTLVVHDVFPWRGPASGGTPFVLSGRGFGNLADTQVTFGGLPATLTEVTQRRIRGITPTQVAPTTDLVEIVVTVGGRSDALSQAYRYLFGPGLEPGRWEALVRLDAPLGDTAAGVLDGVLHIVGEGNARTHRYDALQRSWLPDAAIRPHPGRDQALAGPPL